MDRWLAQVKTRYQAGDGPQFAALVDPDPSSTAFTSVRQLVAVSLEGCL